MTWVSGVSRATGTLIPMTQRRGVQGPPNAYLVDGERWPDGRLLAGLSPSLVRALGIAADVSRRLSAALDGRSISGVARDADVARTTLYDLQRGGTWPDLVSITKLEDVLETSLLGRP